MRHHSSSISFIVMGLSSMLLQITVLRLLLSTFSGNELDIGITLSFWLIYVGFGSYFGRKVGLKHAFIVSFVLVAVISLPTVLAIKAIRSVLALEPGETVSLASTVVSTAVTVFPISFIIGLQFPLAVSQSGDNSAAGRVYGIEAFGAFIGGTLFTFLISSRIDALELCLLLALINILTAVYISGKTKIVIIFIIPLMFYYGFHKAAVALPWHGFEISQTAESRYGEIAVIKVGGQSSIYAGGHLFFTYPDSQNEEMKTHLPMALHPDPLRILVIGGSPGTLKEFLKYPVDEIDFIELDPKIMEIAENLIYKKDDKDALRDRRVRIIIEDGRRFVKNMRGPVYDLIVVNMPQPSTAGINRFYTVEFFKESEEILKKDGVLAIPMSQSTGYIGRSMQTANGSIYNSLKSVFKHVAVTAPEYGGLFASDSMIVTNPAILEYRFIRRAISMKYFSEYIFRDVFSPMDVDYVRERLDEIKIVNTDLRPSAYLYNLMLWAEIHGGKVLQNLPGTREWHIFFILSIILAFTSLLIFRKRKPVIYFSVFTTGFSGMSFMIAVILAYQAAYGYVYEMIGILSAAFMIGLWTGTILTGRTGHKMKALLYLELMTIVLSIAAPLFFKVEFLFYVLTLLSGTLTGGLFSTASLSIGNPEASGKLYGLDLTGSFMGSFIPSIVFIPLFGISHVLLFAAFVKVFSALMILSCIGTSSYSKKV